MPTILGMSHTRFSAGQRLFPDRGLHAEYSTLCGPRWSIVLSTVGITGVYGHGLGRVPVAIVSLTSRYGLGGGIRISGSFVEDLGGLGFTENPIIACAGLWIS